MTEGHTNSAPTLRDASVTDSAQERFRWIDLVVALCVMAGLFGLSWAGGRLVGVLGLSGGAQKAAETAILIAMHLGAIAFLVWYLRKRELGTGLRPLGKDAWHLLWEIPLIFIAVPTVTQIVSRIADLEPLENGGLGANVELGPAFLLKVFVVGAVLAPVLEELIFRRIVMGYFDTVMPAAASVVLSAAVFAVPHLEPMQIVHAFSGGIAFALVARRHRSLWASIIAHLSNNLVVGVIVFAGLAT